MDQDVAEVRAGAEDGAEVGAEAEAEAEVGAEAEAEAGAKSKAGIVRGWSWVWGWGREKESYSRITADTGTHKSAITVGTDTVTGHRCEGKHA